MAEQSGASSGVHNSSMEQQAVRSHTLNSALVLSPFKLDGTNYLAWSQACRMLIEANRMQHFINGTTTMPEKPGMTQEEWKSDNSMVKKWIFNSMKPSMWSSYMFLDTAYELWEAISQTFSVSSDMSKAYDIRKRIRELGQGEKTVAQYFAEINALWQELDHYRVFSAKCTEDAVAYQKFVGEDRVVDFLVGLNIEYDQIRAQLIGQTPFPSLREAHARVQQEESRRRVVVLNLNPVDRSAMVASYPKPVEESRECDYCGGKNHTRDRCFKLYGRPKRRGGRSGSGRGRGSQAYLSTTTLPVDASSTSETTTALTPEEISAFRKFCSKSIYSHYAQSGLGDGAEDWQW